MSAHVSALMKNETVSWIRSRVRSSSLNVSWTLRTPCWFLWINQSFFQAKISTSWKMWKCTLWVFLSHICHRRNNKLFSSFIDSSSLFHDAKIMCFFFSERKSLRNFSSDTYHQGTLKQQIDMTSQFFSTIHGSDLSISHRFWRVPRNHLWLLTY